MARVFIAQRDGATAVCVLKQMFEDFADNPIAVSRFLREAHVSTLLVHPRIGRVIDAGYEDGSFCIVMDLIVGKDIESVMHALMRQKLMVPYPVSLTAIAGVLEALDFAHNATDVHGQPLNVVHRDLSPRNMMLGFDGEARVIDFGMARATLDDFKTKPGMVLGTLRYVSPEQAQALEVGRTSDLYSTAVVLHELLTASIMVSPDKPAEMLKEVVLTIPKPVHELNPALPPALSTVVAKGLAKDPEKRWQTAAEFRAAILEACPDWARTPAAPIAEFMRERFSGDLASLERFRALADGAELEPPDSKTRTAMVSMSQVVPMSVTPAEPVLLTKTGFNFPMIPSTTVAPTRIVEITGPGPTEPRAQPDPLREQRLVRNAMVKGAAIATGLLTVVIAVGVILFLIVERPDPVPATVSAPTPIVAPVLGVQAKPEPPPSDAQASPEPPPARAARPPRPPPVARLPVAAPPDVPAPSRAPVNDVRALEAMANEAANSQLDDPIRVEFIRRARSFIAAVPEADRAPVDAAYQAATRRGAGRAEYEGLARALARGVSHP